MCLGHKWIPANRELFFLNVGLNMKRWYTILKYIESDVKHHNPI